MSQIIKISIKCHNYKNCLNNEILWLNKHLEYYQELLCLSKINNKTNFTLNKSMNNLKNLINEEITDFEYSNFLCILPKNHDGKCKKDVHSLLFNNNSIKNIFNYIYTTPGNDGYIYKNRSSRLFPIQISSDNEKRIKNKEIKLKCSIPLKDASSPILLASCYLDILTLVLHINGIEKFINNGIYTIYKQIINKHKNYLINYYTNRTIFINNFTVCPILKKELNITELISNDRNNSIQLGHLIPKTDTEYTLRGLNILLMSRRGNMILGDYNFLEDKWISELKFIVLSKI